MLLALLLTAETLIDGLPTWLGSASATALLGWYAWHTATKTIPNLVNDFRAEMKESREACATEKQGHLDAFRAELREERQHREASSTRIATALDKLSDSVKSRNVQA